MSRNKECPIFKEFPEVFVDKISSKECLKCKHRKLENETLIPVLESACRNKILEKEKYMNHIKELYKKGYKYILKVTDLNNKSYLFADNSLWKTKECINLYDIYDGIEHFKYDQAKEEADKFQQLHPNWIVQIKEISFDKKIRSI